MEVKGWGGQGVVDLRGRGGRGGGRWWGSRGGVGVGVVVSRG